MKKRLLTINNELVVFITKNQNKSRGMDPGKKIDTKEHTFESRAINKRQSHRPKFFYRFTLKDIIKQIISLSNHILRKGDYIL